MQTITELLSRIKNAVYGKDVREAIHDAIATCYSDTSTGKTTAETAAAAANSAALLASSAAESAAMVGVMVVAELPEATASNHGRMALVTGTNEHLYVNLMTSGTYSWVQIK